MKKHSIILLGAVLFAANSFSQNINWTAKPFDHNIFIENKGQFNADVSTGDKILYQVQLGDIKAYFTANGIVYRYNKFSKPHETAEKEGDKEEIKQETHFLAATWVGANKNTTIETEGKQTYYYTYPSGLNSTIKADVFKKIIYRNIYKGVDIEYYFPDGKSGIEYDVMVHPGADVSAVKLKYAGAEKIAIDANGNVVIKSGVGEMTDHAPLSYIGDKKGPTIKTAFSLKENTETFSMNEAYDKSNDLIVDPWTTNPYFTTSCDKAYTVDYDSTGNVYAYGSANHFQLAKLSNTGALQWVFNATTLVNGCYGDFTVDKTTGTCYLTEGYDAAGAKVLKVNTLGSLLATDSGTLKLDEMWRIKYSPYIHQLIIGAGGTDTTYQAALLDTSLITLTPLNVMNVTTAYHDVCLFAMDPSGTSCYICSTSDAIDTGNANNFLFKLPIPGLVPAAFSTRDGFHFLEDGSVNYIGKGTSSGNYANGYNGIAASENWLYLYDGATLERLNKNTGTIYQKVKISNRVADGSVYYNLYSGGLDADTCDNIYVGYDSAVEVFNSSMTLSKSMIFPDTIYDILLGRGILYTCGAGFVSATSISDTCMIITSVPNVLNNDLSVTIYPNPSKGIFTIKSSGITGQASVEVFNVLGEKIFNEVLPQSKDKNIIDLSNESAGVYLYKVISERGECLASGKLVVE